VSEREREEEEEEEEESEEEIRALKWGARARDGAHMFCTYRSIPAPLITMVG
jgi:hypothetical protein